MTKNPWQLRKNRTIFPCCGNGHCFHLLLDQISKYHILFCAVWLSLINRSFHVKIPKEALFRNQTECHLFTSMLKTNKLRAHTSRSMVFNDFEMLFSHDMSLKIKKNVFYKSKGRCTGFKMHRPAKKFLFK